MNPATTVTWKSWSKKWGHWNTWRRPTGDSTKLLTFDDSPQRILLSAGPRQTIPLQDRTAQPDALSMVTQASLTVVR